MDFTYILAPSYRAYIMIYEPKCSYLTTPILNILFRFSLTMNDDSSEAFGINRNVQVLLLLKFMFYSKYIVRVLCT